MPKTWMVFFATLCALKAIAHLFVDITPRAYPLTVGFGIPILLAIVSAVDRSSMRSIWLALLALSFGVLNAGRLGAWLEPVVFAAVAI